MGRPDICSKGRLAADIDNNDVRADFPDIFKGNHIFRFASEQRGKFILAGDDDLTYLSGAFVEFQITDFSKAFAVFKINDFFTFQF